MGVSRPNSYFNTLQNRYLTFAFCSKVLCFHTGEVYAMRVLGEGKSAVYLRLCSIVRDVEV